MLSSTTLPTAIARPAKLMKFRDIPYKFTNITPVKTLNGIEQAIMNVGLRAV